MWLASKRLACSTSCKGLIHVSSSPTNRYSGKVLPCSSIGSSRCSTWMGRSCAHLRHQRRHQILSHAMQWI
jgi:hypothetical protein